MNNDITKLTLQEASKKGPKLRELYLSTTSSGIQQHFRKTIPPHKTTSSREANRYRSDLLRETDRLIILLNNSTLLPYQIREMNDQVNRNLKEIRKYELRILQMKGFIVDDVRFSDEGVWFKDRVYYGRAKDLLMEDKELCISDEEYYGVEEEEEKVECNHK